MSKRRSRDHPEDAEWGCHKDTIRQLYITENTPLEGSDGVVEKMQKLYSFFKTPRQYQARFKEWGFRKNRRGVEWGIVGRKIAARKEAGKESVVYLEGKRLPQAIVNKQTYRNSYDLAFRQYNHGSMPTTPEGFTFLTPVAEDRELFQTSNLPFMDFQSAIRLKGIALMSPIDPHNIHDVHLSHHTSRFPYSASSESRTPSEEVPLPQSSQITELHQNTANLHYSIVVPTLRSLLPTTAIEEYSESGPRKPLPIETMHAAHLKLLCYSVANNFAGVTGFSLEMIWKYVRNHISMPRLMELAPGPTTKALAEKLFNCAIESGDVPAVEYLLQKRYVDVNNQVCVIENVRYTPIARSAKLSDIPMTKLLIQHKADVNKAYVKSGFRGTCALEHAATKFENKLRADPALVQILVDSGANCDFPTLQNVIRMDARVAEIILRKGAHGNHNAWVEQGILITAVKYLDSVTATRIVQIMVTVGANINYCPKFTGSSGISGITVLDTAAKQGYFGLVQFLVNHGASLTENTLICAIQSTNMDLVQCFLHVGAEIDSCLKIYDGYHTPYSEAIRNGNMDLVQLLQDRGALCHITEKSRFSAAVCAASQVGNLEILQSLVLTGATEHEGELGGALVEASKAGREEAALLLIDAGACIKEESLCEALSRKMGSLVRALLNVDVDVNCFTPRTTALQAAIEWGDHSIIKDLVFAGARVNEVRNSFPYDAALPLAIKKNDKELIRYLLAKGADMNNNLARSSDSALAAAVSTGDIDLIKFLLEEGADPNDDTALLKATSKSSDLLNLLLAAFLRRYPQGKKGYGSEALSKAIRDDDSTLWEALLKVNADICRICWEDGTGKAPLALAIEKKNLALVQRLLDCEIDLNDIISVSSRDGFGNTGPLRLTALLVAVCTKDPQMVQLLINKGADVNFAATRGVKTTPLQMAAKIGSLAIVQVLIRNSAEVNAQPAYRGGATALQWAAIGGFIGVAEELLKRGADVNAPPAKLHGRTALEGAIEHGRIDMVQFLLNAQAEFKGPGDRQYERAMKYARDNGHRALAEMLESFSQSCQNTRAEYILLEDN